MGSIRERGPQANALAHGIVMRLQRGDGCLILCGRNANATRRLLDGRNQENNEKEGAARTQGASPQSTGSQAGRQAERRGVSVQIRSDGQARVDERTAAGYCDAEAPGRVGRL